jgi:hypothetical protein
MTICILVKNASAKLRELGYLPWRTQRLILVSQGSRRMTDRDLNFLARQIERLINDVGSFRDDMRVLTAMMLRQDNTRAGWSKKCVRSTNRSAV